MSDPGEVIVRDALARGIKVVPVPAASACVTALAVSGQDTSRWVFEGFLPVNRKQKKEGTKIKELTDLAANATDFTESDIVERNAKIILNFITFMHNNDLLCED